MTGPKAEPRVFVILGATGDLAKRKLLPALHRMLDRHGPDAGHAVLAVGRKSDLDDDAYRALASRALADAGLSPEKSGAWCDECIHYHCLPEGDAADCRKLGARIEALEKEHGLPGNRVFYLGLPPERFAPTITALGEAGLATGPGWTRLVIEKPFGRDLDSARELNRIAHRHFDETQIYRIDHYLGKETVQNLLVFRLANAVFESLWNRDHVESVQILVGEKLGVGKRAGYYDESGALRDMVQNHLTQLLSLVAMEVPVSIEAEEIRHEKTKVLRSVSPILPEDVVFGQYAAGTDGDEEMKGYLEEDGVKKGSRTETFVSLRLELDNWRWQGVPFYIRTGKRLAKRLTQIAVTFRQPPVCLFQSMGSCLLHSNVLLITLQPDEGFALHFDVKSPGEPFDLRTIPLSFRYADTFEDIPDAYETLLLDVLLGDQTLFVHADEVEASWKLYEPLLEREHEIHSYPAGSWGPSAAERHFVRGAPEWMDLKLDAVR